MTLCAGLERDRAVGRRRPGLELAGLGHGAARELRTADAGREAEVVFDAPRRTGLAAQRGALEHERLQPLGRAVDRRAETGRPGSDDHEVDLLQRLELHADAEGPGDLAVAGVAQLCSAREPDERQLLRLERRDGRRGSGIVAMLAVAPGVREPCPLCVLHYPAGVR